MLQVKLMLSNLTLVKFRKLKLLLWKKWTLTNDVITLVSLNYITQRTPLEE